MNREEIKKIIMQDPDTFARELIAMLDDRIKKSHVGGEQHTPQTTPCAICGALTDSTPWDIKKHEAWHRTRNTDNRCPMKYASSNNRFEPQQCALEVGHMRPHVSTRGLSF